MSLSHCHFNFYLHMLQVVTHNYDLSYFKIYDTSTCEKSEPPSLFVVTKTMTNVNCQSTATKYRRKRIFGNNNDISSRAVNNDKTIAAPNFGSCDRTFTL